MTHEQYLDMLKWLDERISIVIRQYLIGSSDLEANEEVGRSIFVTSPDGEKD